MHSYLGAVSLLLLCLSPSSAYLDGAREESCYDHSITHRADLGGGIFQDATTATCSPCSYQLVLVENSTTEVGPMEEFLYSADTTYTFELRATVNGYLGFLIQARDDNGDGVFNQSSRIVGRWDSGTDHRILDCRESINSPINTSPQQNSVTHANAENFRGRNAPYSTTLRWTAPREEDLPPGKITFWYTIVQQLLNDFYPVAGPIGIRPTTPPPPPPPSMPTPSPTPTPTAPTPTSSPDPSIPPYVWIIVGVVIGVLLLLIITVIIVIICVRLRKRSNGEKDNKVEYHTQTDEVKTNSLE